MSDPYDLERFLAAQRDTYAVALGEIRAGRKRTHWMWFVFPQIAGLGSSATAVRYALRSVDEAQAYLEHAVLGARIRECLASLAGLAEDDPVAVFGAVDAMKLRSSLTLFEAAGGGAAFAAGIERWFKGERDAGTLVRIGSS